MIDSLLELFEDGTELHPVEPSLWSVLEPGGASARYDSIVASYDRMIGSRLYRRLAWGDAPEGDAEFAALANKLRVEQAIALHFEPLPEKNVPADYVGTTTPHGPRDAAPNEAEI